MHIAFFIVGSTIRIGGSQEMIVNSLISELAALRLRQRRLLKRLRDKNVLDWDGAIDTNDPELKAVSDEMFSNWKEDMEKFSSAPMSVADKP
jgi:hypothetical protein